MNPDVILFQADAQDTNTLDDAINDLMHASEVEGHKEGDTFPIFDDCGSQLSRIELVRGDKDEHLHIVLRFGGF